MADHVPVTFWAWETMKKPTWKKGEITPKCKNCGSKRWWSPFFPGQFFRSFMVDDLIEKISVQSYLRLKTTY